MQSECFQQSKLYTRHRQKEKGSKAHSNPSTGKTYETHSSMGEQMDQVMPRYTSDDQGATPVRADI